MSHTLKDRPQPRKEQDESELRRERAKRSQIKRKIHTLDIEDWEELDDLESFEKM